MNEIKRIVWKSNILLVIICVILTFISGSGGTSNAALIPDAGGRFFQDTNTSWYWYTGVDEFINQTWANAKSNIEVLDTMNGLTWQMASPNDVLTLNVYNVGVEILSAGLFKKTFSASPPWIPFDSVEGYLDDVGTHKIAHAYFNDINLSIYSPFGDIPLSSRGAFAVSKNSPTVPIPGAAWILGAGLTGLAGIRQKRKRNNK